MVMYMPKQKTKIDDKTIEVINIYEENGKKFEDILTETIQKSRIQKQWLSNTGKVKKENF